ncbi:MAG: TIGR01212 family radical SAM protein, partial [Candidatus Schekmanbacteria bacterium RBG_13_48_7]
DLGFKAFKITLDVGFTCPNRDGFLGIGGCIYCNNKGFNPNSLQPARSIQQQLMEGSAALRKRYRVDRFIAYFQAFTNTYASVDKLKSIYDEVLEFKDVIGLSIGTRPDCLSEEIVDLIAEYRDKTYLWVEVGLQSARNETLRMINRGHDLHCFIDAVERLHKHKIRVCAHVIIGLPEETRNDVLFTAKTIADLGCEGLKIHPLHVIKDTVLAEKYDNNELKLLSLQEYASLVVDFLETIPPTIAIQRITAEGPADYHVAPDWCLDKQSVLKQIDLELENRMSYQGKEWLKQNNLCR